jgi:hypothetical protein
MSRLDKFIDESETGREIISLLKKNCKNFINELKGGIKHCLYRGYGTKSINGFIILKPHIDDREPVDTPKELHNYLNDKFKKKFGWNVRNGVFTFPSDLATYKYGNNSLFFPIGKYRYVYSKVFEDLYEHVDNLRFIIPFFDGGELNTSSLHDDYLRIYGKGMEGDWHYNGKPTGYKEMRRLVNKIKDENDGNIDYNKIEWVPKVSEETYYEIKREKMENEIDSIIKTYKSSNLKNTKPYVEIIFDCDKYYLINPQYENIINSTFFGSK